MLTAAGLVSYFQKAVKEKWGYVWSLNGELYTQAMAQKFHDTRRSTSSSRNPATYWLKDCAKWIGKMAADCSGGIIGALRTVNKSAADKTANTLYSECTEKGPIATLPEIPGLCVWKSGHIEIYEGGCNSIGFRGTDYGAYRTPLNPSTGVNPQKFTHWGKLRDVDYGDIKVTPTPTVIERNLKLTSPYMRGDDVKALQKALSAAGYSCGTIDGIFGVKTDVAVRAFQKARKLTVDGIAGAKTKAMLGI